MSWNIGWVELNAVSEVLLGFKVVAVVGQLSCKMDARSKVTLVDRQTLLKVVNSLFGVLNSLILAPKIEISLQESLFVRFI